MLLLMKQLPKQLQKSSHDSFFLQLHFDLQEQENKMVTFKGHR